MNKTAYTLRKLQSNDSIPFDLLLLADETIEAIEKYIFDSEVYIASENEQLTPVAVVALYKISEADIEIKNIAVAEKWQRKGIGSCLISEVKKIAIANQYENILVGTADGSSRQIHFYEKNGFVKYAVKKDFFIENYAEPIIEDGVMLRDMVMLKMKI